MRTPESFYFDNENDSELFENGEYIGEVFGFSADEWRTVEPGDSIGGLPVISASVCFSNFGGEDVQLLAETIQLGGTIELTGILRRIDDNHMIYDEGDLFFYPYLDSLKANSLVSVPSAAYKGTQISAESGFSAYADTYAIYLGNTSDFSEIENIPEGEISEVTVTISDLRLEYYPYRSGESRSYAVLLGFN